MMGRVKVYYEKTEHVPKGSAYIIFRVPPSEGYRVRMLEDAMRQDRQAALDLTVGKHKEKRSLDQNAYFWALVGEIAAALRADNREIYRALLESYTEPEYMTFPMAAQKRLLQEPFRVIKILEEDGETAAGLCWYSSKYLNTAEFSRLIDGTLYEAREAGIDPEAVRMKLEER